MTSTHDDLLARKAEQRETWNAVSTGWRAWQDQFEQGAASVTARLLKLGGVRQGQAVLDIGTGIGEPALSAVRTVGSTGRVVGVDLAPEMIAVARRRGRDVENVVFLEGDMEALDLGAGSFDVVLSRWSLMFAVDRLAALLSVARLLKPGGVLAGAVWGPPSSVPMIALAFRVIADRLSLDPPPPGVPSPFSLADPQHVDEELTQAGFVNVAVEELVVPFRLPSIGQFVEFARDVLPPRMRDVLRSRCGSVHDPSTWEAVAQAAEEYVVDGTEVLLPSTALCFRAVVPG
jgi:ubiquinone/menaquinone biosynthesis C-methylase UbiE